MVISLRDINKEYEQSIPVVPTDQSLWKRIFVKQQNQNFTALKNINLDIQSGERIAFIGPNGAGKSTAIKILTGILRPTSGEVKVLGLTPWQERKALSRNISFVFGQAFHMRQELSVSKNFELMGILYGLEKKHVQQRADHLISVFDIESILHKKFSVLSLGEKMKANIAGSMLHRPDIYFLDEPTIGLDPRIKTILRQFIKQEISDNSSTLLLTSHDTDDIEEICDRVIILNRGEIIVDMSLADLKKNFLKQRIYILSFEEKNIDFSDIPIKPKSLGSGRFAFTLDLNLINPRDFLSQIFYRYTVIDMETKSPSVDDIISHIYSI